MNRTSKVIKPGIGAIALVTAYMAWAAPTSGATAITVYKDPACGCCGKWVESLRQNGFKVKTEEVYDISKVEAERGVPAVLNACHTAVVDGYVVEGHVPVSAIRRVLAEHPQVKGIGVPGMPPGSPGMEGARNIPYNVLTFDAKGQTTVYARHRSSSLGVPTT